MLSGLQRRTNIFMPCISELTLPKWKTGTILLSKEDIEKHRKVARTDYIWQAWPKEMALKTVIKKACKQHFDDIYEGINEMDNENYDLDLPLDVDLKHKEAIEKIVSAEGGVVEEETFDKVKLRWTDQARKLIYSVPDGYQRRRSKAQIEKKARTRKIPTITLQMVEDVVRETVKDTAALEARGLLTKTAVDAAENAAFKPRVSAGPGGEVLPACGNDTGSDPVDDPGDCFGAVIGRSSGPGGAAARRCPYLEAAVLRQAGRKGEPAFRGAFRPRQAGAGGHGRGRRPGPVHRAGGWPRDVFREPGIEKGPPMAFAERIHFRPGQENPRRRGDLPHH
ncbi:MAG: recombinase RecT [candidate division Zixibacteria bacterium]|nr:recombinase RecT [candidate division Zixibacteria bacterium]